MSQSDRSPPREETRFSLPWIKNEAGTRVDTASLEIVLMRGNDTRKWRRVTRDAWFASVGQEDQCREAAFELRTAGQRGVRERVFERAGSKCKGPVVRGARCLEAEKGPQRGGVRINGSVVR